MPGPSTKITPREKAALLMYAAGLETEWTELYLIADDKPAKEAREDKNLIQYVSRWKHSTKVEKALAEYSKLFADRDADERRKGAEEERRRQEEKQNTGGDSDRDAGKPGGKFAKPLDFYDPENQRKQINRIISESNDDPRTQLDAIKAIQATQRDDKQAARDQKQVRAYLPQRCDACPLYLKARKKL